MEQAILIVHVLAAIAIIGLILLQQGKGSEMGASFGAGASQTLFGSDGGGNVLTKATSWLAVLFFCTSLGLAIVAKEKVQGAAQVDLPAPAVIESQEIPDLPGQDGELPAAIDLPAIEEASEIPAGDIPVQ
jgi:preprotein translocase subunit SecG